MSVTKILAEQNIQSLIKWKWNADCIIMYKNGDWTIDSWDSPSITQPTKDEIKIVEVLSLLLKDITLPNSSSFKLISSVVKFSVPSSSIIEVNCGKPTFLISS